MKLSSIKSSDLTFPTLALETARIRLMLLSPAMDGKGFRRILALQTGHRIPLPSRPRLPAMGTVPRSGATFGQRR